MKVFWSWQSDSQGKVSRHFVNLVISELLGELSKECALEDADRPELDHDTKGVNGWVAIADTIFDKIDHAVAFVADMTLTASTPNGKRSPNPNVLIELGYALKSLGDTSILLVWNSANGAEPTDLPFDMCHRRAPISYCLPDSATSAEIRLESEQLKNSLRVPLKTCIDLALKHRDDQRVFKRQAERTGDPSIWTAAGEQIDGYSLWDKSEWTRFAVHESARSYVRIVPYGWTERKPTPEAVAKCCQTTWGLGPLCEPDTELGGLARNSRGVAYIYDCKYPSPTTHSATQWFEDNGEVWAFDASIMNEQNGLRRIDARLLARNWHKFLHETVDVYRKLNKDFPIAFPIRIDVGVSGLANSCWLDAAPDIGMFIAQPKGNFAKAPQIHSYTILRSLDSAAIDSFLLTARLALAQNFGIDDQLLI